MVIIIPVILHLAAPVYTPQATAWNVSGTISISGESLSWTPSGTNGGSGGLLGFMNVYGFNGVDGTRTNAGSQANPWLINGMIISNSAAAVSIFSIDGLQTTTYVVFSNNQIYFTGTWGTYDMSIGSGTGGGHFTVEGCDLKGGSGGCIYLGPHAIQEVNIINNYLHDFGGNAIRNYYGALDSIPTFTITYNHFLTGVTNTASVYLLSGALISNNNFDQEMSYMSSGLLFVTSNTQVTSNTFNDYGEIYAYSTGNANPYYISITQNKFAKGVVATLWENGVEMFTRNQFPSASNSVFQWGQDSGSGVTGPSYCYLDDGTFGNYWPGYSGGSGSDGYVWVGGSVTHSYGATITDHYPLSSSDDPLSPSAKWKYPFSISYIKIINNANAASYARYSDANGFAASHGTGTISDPYVIGNTDGVTYYIIDAMNRFNGIEITATTCYIKISQAKIMNAPITYNAVAKHGIYIHDVPTGGIQIVAAPSSIQACSDSVKISLANGVTISNIDFSIYPSGCTGITIDASNNIVISNCKIVTSSTFKITETGICTGISITGNIITLGTGLIASASTPGAISCTGNYYQDFFLIYPNVKSNIARSFLYKTISVGSGICDITPKYSDSIFQNANAYTGHGAIPVSYPSIVYTLGYKPANVHLYINNANTPTMSSFTPVGIEYRVTITDLTNATMFQAVRNVIWEVTVPTIKILNGTAMVAQADTGAGTAGNPYIIQGRVVNANGVASLSGIEIGNLGAGNTSYYLKVEHCNVTGCTSSAKAIYIHDTSWIKVDQCNINANAGEGVDAYNSNSIYITGNTFASITRPIVLNKVNGGFVFTNQLVQSDGLGVLMNNTSSNIMIKNNTIAGGSGTFQLHADATVTNVVVTGNVFDSGQLLMANATYINMTGNSYLDYFTVVPQATSTLNKVLLLSYSLNSGKDIKPRYSTGNFTNKFSQQVNRDALLNFLGISLNCRVWMDDPTNSSGNMILPGTSFTPAGMLYRTTIKDATLDVTLYDVVRSLSWATNPYVTYLSPANKTFYNPGSSVNITARVVDYQSTITGITCVFKSGLVTTANFTLSPSSYPNQFMNIYDTSSFAANRGNFTLWITATDLAGHLTVDHSIMIRYINALPVIVYPLVTPQNLTTERTDFYVNATVVAGTYPISHVWLTSNKTGDINHVMVSNGPAYYVKISLYDYAFGDYKFTVHANDTQNEVSQVSIKLHLKQPIMPTVIITTPLNLATENANYHVNATVMSSYAIGSAWIVITSMANSSLAGNVTMQQKGAVYTATISIYKYPVGQYNMTVVMQDIHHNRGNASVLVQSYPPERLHVSEITYQASNVNPGIQIQAQVTLHHDLFLQSRETWVYLSSNWTDAAFGYVRRGSNEYDDLELYNNTLFHFIFPSFQASDDVMLFDINTPVISAPVNGINQVNSSYFYQEYSITTTHAFTSIIIPSTSLTSNQGDWNYTLQLLSPDGTKWETVDARTYHFQVNGSSYFYYFSFILPSISPGQVIRYRVVGVLVPGSVVNYTNLLEGGLLAGSVAVVLGVVFFMSPLKKNMDRRLYKYSTIGLTIGVPIIILLIFLV